MTNLLRARAVWSGFPGSPGYSSFYVAGAEDPTVATTVLTSVHDLFNALRTLLPGDAVVSFPGDMAIVDDTTGQQVSAVSVTPPANVTGSGSGPYSAASGFGIDWQTSTISNGRAVRGRTFFVPAASATAFDATGQVSASARGTILTAADAFRTANDGVFRIIMRPTAARPVGSSAVVTGGTAPQKVFVLTSRRD